MPLTTNPTPSAAAALMPTIFASRTTGTLSESSTGMSSSEVERNTASSVPTLTTPPA